MSSLIKTLINLLPVSTYLSLKRTAYSLLHRKQYKNIQTKRKITTENPHSVKPFDDTRSIFIHIPKCAGVSVKKALYGSRPGAHSTLSDYTCIFSPKEIQDYFKFTVVRNPWDRLVSAFHFLKKGGMNEADKTWAESNIKDYDDFESFVQNWLNRDNIWKYYHFYPQYHFFLDAHERVLPNYFAFLENIDSDLEYIGKKVNKNYELQKNNKSHHKNYMDYYNNSTLEIVSSVYAEDIRLLGYTFDNSGLDKQLNDRDKAGGFPYLRTMKHPR